MRREYPHFVEQGRERQGQYGSPPGARYGCFRVRHPQHGHLFLCIVGDAESWRAEGLPEPGWDHVSVSIAGQRRCPTWAEMCWVKELFFDPEETVVQFHPAASRYVNVHEFVLHLWRIEGVFPVPPIECV